ncbi:hypothetical protein HN954_01585 [bacterium]|jgi:hypothetical protein|nr:hypothetical protein [bacterium]MBT6996101.1 hypothetical protein [bacterium]
MYEFFAKTLQIPFFSDFEEKSPKHNILCWGRILYPKYWGVKKRGLIFLRKYFVEKMCSLSSTFCEQLGAIKIKKSIENKTSSKKH